jgi:glyoxylase-like metal-dependent hydrolase (beta-lactamase superfamily II)
MGALRPHAFRFSLGAFEVTLLLDGIVALDGPHPIFGENQPPEAVAQLCEQHFLPTRRMAISFAPVLVNTGAQLVLFDSGNPAARREAGAARLVEALQAAGYTPDQVDVVVLTHFHPDHIGGLLTDGAPTWPNATYVSSAAEYEFWSAEERLSGPTEGTAKLVRANVLPLRERLRFVKDEEEVLPGIRAMDTAGHTPGHMAFHIESEGKRLLVWGDVANHFVLSVERPDWHVRFDMDKERAVATRRRVLDMLATERIPVTGYHMPFPNVGYIDRSGGSYRWVRVSYQFDV